MLTTPVDPSEDHALVTRARRGDREAFGALYARHARGVYSLILRMSGDPAVAEDVTQDAFVSAFTGLPRFRGDAPVAAWLKRMAANAWIDRVRRDRRWEPIAGDAVAPSVDPSAMADAASLLAGLPPMTRTLLWLHCAEGWTHVELAARFRRSESWSKSIIARTLARLGEVGEPTP